MARQEDRRATTRAALVAAARAAFVEEGYEKATTARILARAGLSKGALYHHFPDKVALFEAVFDAVSKEAIAIATRAARRTTTPDNRLAAACFAWIKAVETPAVGRIMLEDGPRALGWRRAKAIEEGNAASVMRAGLVAAMGSAPPSKVDLAMRLLNAALGELALLRREAGARRPSDRDAKRAIGSLIRGLAQR